MRPANGAFWLGTVYLVTVCCLSWCGSGVAAIGGRESYLRIGKAINIFVRYGYLGISMRVIPHNGSSEGERWLFKEPTKNIYKNISELAVSQENEKPGVFHGDFHIEFCENRRQLFQAYFRDFTIELLDKPWEVFTGGWFPENAAKKLGINSSFIQGDYAYILVRVVRFREVGKLRTEIPLNQTLENDVRERIRQLRVGNVTGAIKFMEAFGTHYINSYSTGNSIYQVFVYNRDNYELVKERIKTKSIKNLSISDLYNYFSPWCATHVGHVRTASANATVERWARRKLQHGNLAVSYQTLLKVHGNITLLRSLDVMLGNEAIVQLDLKSLNLIFRDERPEKQNWFHEVLANQLQLWEVNMPQNYN